uniref:DUF4777 domain-containing protein n=1 Tax=Glossina austeni TaxID=7395 RepID=A0A1A9UWE8_GLOAU
MFECFLQILAFLVLDIELSICEILLAYSAIIKVAAAKLLLSPLEMPIKVSKQIKHVVMRSLKELQEPASYTAIVNHIADKTGIHPEVITMWAPRALKTFIQHGFVEKIEDKYQLAQSRGDAQASSDRS